MLLFSMSSLQENKGMTQDGKPNGVCVYNNNNNNGNQAYDVNDGAYIIDRHIIIVFKRNISWPTK